MTDWIEQYSSALDERDTREQAHKSYIDAYTKLADRTSTLSPSNPTAAPPSPHPPESSKDRTSTPTKTPKDPEQSSPADLLTNLRTDLTTTQKARASLQTRVDDLTTDLRTLTTQTQSSATQLKALTAQKATLDRQLRDREEEIRGKSKLVEQAQDEMVSLGLQLNMAEARSEKLEVENKELVERWMRRVGEEAERVNRESRWE